MITQEQIDDIKNIEPFDPSIELEYVQNEIRKENLDILLDEKEEVNNDDLKIK